MNASEAELAPVLRANFMQPVIQATNNILVVDTARERILVDTGFGEKLGPSFGSFPGLGANLRRAGITPESIDLVVTSHGHLDHIGGLVTKTGALAFPKAQFVFVDTEWNCWTGSRYESEVNSSPMPDPFKMATIGAVRDMSIADVVDDIDKVARCFDTPPVLIAHSMGGLAAQLYASAHEVGALVLLTPVVPSNVGATPHELPIGDMDAPWGPPPPDLARQMFFQGLDDMQAAHFYALLVPESPLRVYEATRWSLAVDATKLTAPILIVSGALDILTPPETGAALAALYGATYQLEPAHGHNVLLGEGARRIAEDVIAWLVGRLAH